MNILALNWQDLKNPFAGGAEVHLEELLRRLVKRGHRVTLLCSSFPGAASEEIVDGVRVVRAGSRYDFNFVAPRRLRKLIRAERFDALIEDINKIPFYTPLYAKIPTLVVVPHLFSTSVFQEINFVLGSYIYLFERPLTRIYRGRKFNVISESTAHDLIRRGVSQRDISIVHCGIDHVSYHPDPAIEKHATPTILYLGRVKKYKSVQHLISALGIVRKRLPNARLEVVGAGDYLPALQEQVEGVRLTDAVDFLGFVNAAEKVRRLRQAHVCVCPSLKEGWGLTNIEANACGTAVIAANVDGLRDSVRHGESGLLYTYGAIEELAGSILRVLTDSNFRKTLEEGGLRWAARFNWDDTAVEFERVVAQVAGAGLISAGEG